jgi:hypothetical protein
MHTVYQLRLALVFFIFYLVTNLVIFSLDIQNVENEALKNEVIIINACAWACLVATMLSIRTWIGYEYGRQRHECDSIVSVLIWEFGGFTGIITSCILLSEISHQDRDWSLLGEPIFIFTLLPFYGFCLIIGAALLAVCVYWSGICCHEVIRSMPICCTVMKTSCYNCWCAPVVTAPLAAVIVVPTEVVAKPVAKSPAPSPSAPPIQKQNEMPVTTTITETTMENMKIFKSDNCVICLTSFANDNQVKVLMTCGHLCCHLKCAVQVCPLCRKGKPFKNVYDNL